MADSNPNTRMNRREFFALITAAVGGQQVEPKCEYLRAARFDVQEIARIFNVPMHMLPEDLDQITFGNIEQRILSMRKLP